MARRQKQAELEFGSDSFLDVIANMVGIIIILIVIAGLRVGHGPSRLASEQDSMTVIAEAQRESQEQAEKENSPEENPQTLRSKQEVLELAERIAELKNEQKLLGTRIQETRNQQGDLERTREEWVESYEDLAEELSEGNRVVVEDNLALQASLRSVEERKEELSILLNQISQLENKPLPVKRIKHSITPISRSVEKDETHFRISQNKVSHVPLQEMLERLKMQAERQKDAIVKNGRNEGVLGPCEGYLMRYLIERQQLSAAEHYQYGQGVFKIGVSSFQIEPDKSLSEESIEKALKPNSRFMKAIKNSPRNSTYTFWVYPDSYSGFRRLQSLLHEGGLTVAARPMPPGIPISGSPGGTRSAGQ